MNDPTDNEVIHRLTELRVIADAHGREVEVPLSALRPSELAWLVDQAREAITLRVQLENSKREARVLRDLYLTERGGGA